MILKKNANRIKTIDLDNLNFNSLKKHKCLREFRNKERNEYPNKILSINPNDLESIISKSLTFKDIKMNIRQNINIINNRDWIKIPINTLLDKSILDSI